jgi:hypothetical protein
MQAAAPNIPNDRTVDLRKVYDAIVDGTRISCRGVAEGSSLQKLEKMTDAFTIQ